MSSDEPQQHNHRNKTDNEQCEPDWTCKGLYLSSQEVRGKAVQRRPQNPARRIEQDEPRPIHLIDASENGGQ